MPDPSCTPWRSVWLPQAITAVALVVGLPLFLRSPPWCDITLYQMAARNILHGGVHYHDLFDTNLPGFVWVITALSALFGPNVIAVRAVDLGVVLGTVLVLNRLAAAGGATPAGRWWMIAGVAVLYPFTVEMSHAQRDTWMTLPALAAVALRLRRCVGAVEPAPRVVRATVYEGLLWGAAVWIKPHVALMALSVWLFTARRLVGGRPRPRRAVAADLLGNLLGGLAVGLPGVAWMVWSGAWGPFVDVFTEWNPRYMTLARREFWSRAERGLDWFPPWSLWLVLTVPVAVASALDSAFWRDRARADEFPDGWVGRWLPAWLWDGQVGPDARFVRGTLGGLYLVWAAQAFVVQRAFEYVHLPETLLMLCLWAMHRWAWVPLVFLWLTLSGGVWLIADADHETRGLIYRLPPAVRHSYLPRHTLADPNRLRLWPRCWRLNAPDAERYRLWDDLRQHPPHEASPGWVELYEVANYLRGQGVRPHEVVAWFNSPHAVYLMLDLDPAFRHMHVYTTISIFMTPDGDMQPGRGHVIRELEEARRAHPGRPKVRFVISDLEWAATVTGCDAATRAAVVGPPRNPPYDWMPADMPFRRDFPFNQPVAFRTRGGTGRYVVHRIVSFEDTPEPPKPKWEVWRRIGDEEPKEKPKTGEMKPVG